MIVSLTELLFDSLRRLPDLMAVTSSWVSLDVTYEQPRVERLFRKLGEDYRLYLHRIHPVLAGGVALLHPHPWPSAVYVCEGSYDMAVGYGADYAKPDVAARVRLAPGSSYEMSDMHGWHSVSPVGGPSLSVMVTGPRWDRWSPKAPEDRPLKPMSEAGEADLFEAFRRSWVEAQRRHQGRW